MGRKTTLYGADATASANLAAAQIARRAKPGKTKPSRQACRPVPTPTHPTPTPSKSQTKLAQYCRRVLVNSPKFVQEVTWPWMKTEAGANMYVDIVFKELKLALEYQGPQHYRLSRYTRTKKELAALQARDARKAQLLKEHGFVIIQWPFTLCISLRSVFSLLKKNGFAVQMPPRAKPKKRTGTKDAVPSTKPKRRRRKKRPRAIFF